MSNPSQHFATIQAGIGTSILSTEPNTSESYFELERERIFKRTWLNVGRVNEIPKRGDFFTVDLEVIKASVIIARGKDDQVRAFYNICRHRGNKLTRACRGSSTGFACGFHGWTFDLSGTLVYVPDEACFFNLDKAALGMIPLSVAIWEGFIFVNADPNPAETLEQFIGDLGPALKGYPFNDMQIDVEYSITVDCNWKVFSDAFQEAFHVGYIHKNSLPTQFTHPGNPFTHMVEFRLHHHHNVATVLGNPSHVPTPVEAFARSAATSSYGSAVSDDMGELASGINPGKSDGYMFDLHNVFPNFAMHIGIGFYYTFNFIPVSVNKTRWVMRIHGYPPKTASEVISKEYTKIILRDAVKEDINTTENTQRSLESGVMPHMILCDQELLLRHKYKVVEDFIKGANHRTEVES
jgi:phenylpropionate dioxygenase-like ring-hydroxylating dioxygenase large terminal subunit